MNIDTLRFGAIEVDESRAITMKGCILGFDHLHRYILMLQEPPNPLCWLQSIEDGSVAFVVIDPCMIKPDYHPKIHAADQAFLGISRKEEMCLLCIVTIRSHPLAVTANLRAPLVINWEKRLGSQIILDDEDYPIRCEISSAKMEERTDKARVMGL